MKHVRIATYDIKKGSFQELAEVAEDQMPAGVPGPARSQLASWGAARALVLLAPRGSRLPVGPCFFACRTAAGSQVLSHVPAGRWECRTLARRPSRHHSGDQMAAATVFGRVTPPRARARGFRCWTLAPR